MVHLSILRYNIVTGLPPVPVTLVELASVYCAGLPKFDLKSTGNKQVIDRGYNEKKKDGGYGLTRTLSLSFTNAPQLL